MSRSYLFDKYKTQMAVAYCTRCERADVQVVNEKLWCAWCCKECEVVMKNVEVVTKGDFDKLYPIQGDQLIDLNDVKVQPLRVTSGWAMKMRNRLFELDPTRDLVEDTMSFDQTMLVMKHEQRNLLLDVGWCPEGNYDEGSYHLTLYENDYGGEEVGSFTTKDRIELVEKIETLLERVSNGWDLKLIKKRFC